MLNTRSVWMSNICGVCSSVVVISSSVSTSSSLICFSYIYFLWNLLLTKLTLKIHNKLETNRIQHIPSKYLNKPNEKIYAVCFFFFFRLLLLVAAAAADLAAADDDDEDDDGVSGWGCSRYSMLMLATLIWIRLLLFFGCVHCARSQCYNLLERARFFFIWRWWNDESLQIPILMTSFHVFFFVFTRAQLFLLFCALPIFFVSRLFWGVQSKHWHQKCVKRFMNSWMRNWRKKTFSTLHSLQIAHNSLSSLLTMRFPPFKDYRSPLLIFRYLFFCGWCCCCCGNCQYTWWFWFCMKSQ